MTRIILTSLSLLALAACGNNDSSKTTTRLDAVEVQPGTISDSMIILDDAASDGTAVDTSTPSDSSKKPDKVEADSSDSADSAGGDQNVNPDAVPAPAAKKAQTTSQ